MTGRHGSTVIRAVLLLAFASARLAAQQTGVVTGSVAGSDGASLARARVVVIGTRVAVLTDDAGRFRLTAVPSGRQLIEAGYIGYRAVLFQLDVAARETTDVAVVLESAPVPISGVDASAPEIPAMLRGFYERRATGTGTFITREDIEHSHPRLFTDLLRAVPGVRLQAVRGPSGESFVAQSGRSAVASGGSLRNRPCPILYLVDGVRFPVEGDVNINTFIQPGDVAGVEIYTGAARIPVQFQVADAQCGVIVIWTRPAEENARRRAVHRDPAAADST